MERLIPVEEHRDCSLYEIPKTSKDDITRYIATTPETRAICNDPFVVGLRYTDSLKLACEKVLRIWRNKGPLKLHEHQAAVLHILRGGLNFGLREAIGRAYNWNDHASAFVSAQRARKSDNPDDWFITESSYQKVYLPASSSLIFGDVVATGTSLSYALQRVLEIAEDKKSHVRSVIFFTIGGPRSESILRRIHESCRERFPEYEGAAVIYFEGRFEVAEDSTPLSIKITGTDLVRRGSLMAPEFIESQYENATFPLERCTIYDAGSRAFWLPEYFEDLKDYWTQTLQLAGGGMTFQKLLSERFPELDAKRFPAADLRQLAEKQVRRVEQFENAD